MSITAKRSLVLWGVNLLILIHIYLWYGLKQWGLGTISPQGGLDILVDGILTGSAIFTGALVLLTLIFGRLACGWGCHFAAFQETSAAGLKKLGLSIKPLHSRASLIRFGFLGMLLYPPVKSLLQKGLPDFGEVSLRQVEVFTPDLPTGGVLVATILVNALLLTVLLGSRPFCRYVCPWALIFRFLDRFSRWRIRQQKECAGCRTCSDNCLMGIDVQQEIAAYGYVKSTECVRCLTCTKGCPHGALAYTGRPTPFQPGGNYAAPASQLHWSLDLALLIPAVMLAFVAAYKLDNFQAWLGASWGLALVFCVVKAFAPSGRRTRVLALVGAAVLAAGVGWVVLTPTQMQFYNAGNVLLARGDLAGAEQLFRQALSLAPESSRSFDIRLTLARTLDAQGQRDEALGLYREMLQDKPYYDWKVRYDMGLVYTKQARYEEAAEQYRLALAHRPQWPEAHLNRGFCLQQLGREQEGWAEVETALRLDPSLAKRALQRTPGQR